MANALSNISNSYLELFSQFLKSVMKFNNCKEKTLTNTKNDLLTQMSKMELQKYEYEKKSRKMESILIVKNSEIKTL